MDNNHHVVWGVNDVSSETFQRIKQTAVIMEDSPTTSGDLSMQVQARGPAVDGSSNKVDLSAQLAQRLGADMPSIGSLRHGEGRCQPCLLIFSAMGCEKGAECSFCHYHHSRKSRPRPCKAKRHRQQKMLAKAAGKATDSSLGESGEQNSSSGEEDLPQTKMSL